MFFFSLFRKSLYIRNITCLLLWNEKIIPNKITLVMSEYKLQTGKLYLQFLSQRWIHTSVVKGVTEVGNWDPRLRLSRARISTRWWCMSYFNTEPLRSPYEIVQFSRSVVSDSAAPRTAARQASLSITSSWSLPKLMSIESVMPSNHLILCCTLLLLLQSFPASGALGESW